MPSVAAVSVRPTWGKPEMVGAPVAAVPPTPTVAVDSPDASPNESTTLNLKVASPLKSDTGSSTRLVMSSFDTVFGRSELGTTVPESLSVPCALVGRLVTWISFSGSVSVSVNGKSDTANV